MSVISARELKKLPELIVFDLDECLWHPEMYTLNEIPSRTITGNLGSHGVGSIGAISGNEVIRLFPGALAVLQSIYLEEYPNVRIAVASSADTPHAVRIANASLDLLEVVPGVTVRQVLQKGWEAGFRGNIQIGRTPPLSANKAKSHFPILRRETGIEYDKMIFFDDCNWGDNCAMVEQACRGVITKQTPRGLTIQEFNEALLKYSDHYTQH